MLVVPVGPWIAATLDVCTPSAGLWLGFKKEPRRNGASGGEETRSKRGNAYYLNRAPAALKKDRFFGGEFCCYLGSQHRRACSLHSATLVVSVPLVEVNQFPTASPAGCELIHRSSAVRSHG
jgi:hypothetical protein